MTADSPAALGDRLEAVPLPPLAWPRLAGLVAFAFGLGIASNTLEPALLGHKALELVPEQKNTALGLTTFGGLLVAVLWQPIVGGWSDRTNHRWGRRIPFFVAGAFIASFSLLAIAVSPVFGLVALALFAKQLGTNTIAAPGNALIPDRVPMGQRGRVAGVKAMLEILGFIVGRWTSGSLIGQGHVLGAVAFAMGALVVTSAVTIAATGSAGSHAGDSGGAGTTPRGWLRETFHVDWEAHPGFRWWLVNRFLFWGGFIALNTFLLFFLIDVHGLAEAEAQRFVANLSALLGVAILLVALPAGRLADRVGRRSLVAGTGVMAALGTGLLLAARTTPAMIGAGLVLGVGVGVFLSADWALLTDLVPRAAAARYLGIANMAAAGGSASARFIGGALIDPLIEFSGDPRAGYAAVFGLAMVGFLFAAWAILRVPKERTMSRFTEP